MENDPLATLAAPRKTLLPQLTEPTALFFRRRTHLPLHLVGPVAVLEAEAGCEVAGEELLLLDVGQKSRIYGLLVCGPGAGDLLLLFGGNMYISTCISCGFQIHSTKSFAGQNCSKLTSGFSPCLKKASSVFFCCFFSLVK